MKKLLLIVMTLSLFCLLCVMFTSCAFFGGDIKYELNEDGESYRVVWFPKDAEEVVVEATYNDLPVTVIDARATDKCRTTLKKVTLPDSIVSIEMPFNNCELEVINIPSSVKTLGGDISCQELHINDLDAYDELQGQYRISAQKLYVNGVQVKKIEVAGNMGIQISCKELEEISVSGIFEEAKIYLSKYVKVLTIQEGVKQLDIVPLDALLDVGVEKLIIPTTLESVSAGGLTWTALKEIHISDVGKWCQIQFSNWEVNPFSAKDEHIYLNGELLKDLVIPDDVTEMVGNLFRGCNTIESVVIGDGITQLNGWEFAFCQNLKSVTIGKNVAFISGKTFKECDSLETVIFEDKTGWRLYEG